MCWDWKTHGSWDTAQKVCRRKMCCSSPRKETLLNKNQRCAIKATISLFSCHFLPSAASRKAKNPQDETSLSSFQMGQMIA